MEEPPWKKLKLSLERPYKDDNGEPIPLLHDISPEGRQIYEPREDLTANIGKNLHRIFLERGHDFFDKRTEDTQITKAPATGAEDEGEQQTSESTQPMTLEELFKMRMEILPPLHIALGEMCQARDLLSLLLEMPQQSTTTEAPSLNLTATIVSKPPPVQSVQAFNTQLVIGGKDKALRKAADLFKAAAEGMERSRMRSERYWVDALKIRRENWGLIPAPLPLGSATGKGADKISKDFLVSFSLEESPSLFRRRAVARMTTLDTSTSSLEFPQRQQTRLQVSISSPDAPGKQQIARNHLCIPEETTVQESLKAAQAEVVEQEIFSALIKEAGTLPTASARVSERLIVIEAAQATELRFELVDSDSARDESQIPDDSGSTCDLIFSALHLLLLRAHTHIKTQRLGRSGILRLPSTIPDTGPPKLLQPIIDMLQYKVFCERVRFEIDHTVKALRRIGIPTRLHFNAVGESGEQLMQSLRDDKSTHIGGECLVRIGDRHTLRFTFLSPSSLTAHLPQATLSIASIPQLSQLLIDEVSSCLLNRICDVGSELCEHVHDTWFVDLLTSRTVGRWEGRVLNFRIMFTADGSIVCAASRLERGDRHPASHIETYSAEKVPEMSLLEWVRQVIEGALPES